MPGPDLVGVAAVALVTLLTVPCLVNSWRNSSLPFGRGYVQLSQDNSYEDRDGIATEESIRAYSDTRPRVAACLGAALGLGASIATNILVLRDAERTSDLSDFYLWAELACWVRMQIPKAPTLSGSHAELLFRASCTCSVLVSLLVTDIKPNSA